MVVCRAWSVSLTEDHYAIQAQTRKNGAKKIRVRRRASSPCSWVKPRSLSSHIILHTHVPKALHLSFSLSPYLTLCIVPYSFPGHTVLVIQLAGKQVTFFFCFFFASITNTHYQCYFITWSACIHKINKLTCAYYFTHISLAHLNTYLTSQHVLYREKIYKEVILMHALKKFNLPSCEVCLTRMSQTMCFDLSK